jgi:hypothetical protein
MRLTIFFVGSFIVAFLSAAIFLFISAYDNKDSLVTAPIQSDENHIPSQNKTEKWH